TPPEDVSWCRGRSPGSRVVACILAFPKPNSFSGAIWTKAHRLQLRGQLRYCFSGAPDSLLALDHLIRETVTTIFSMMRAIDVNGWDSRSRTSFSERLPDSSIRGKSAAV